MRIGLLSISILLTGFLAACTPTVKVEAPSEPININLNVKIQHEIYIKVDKELDNILNSSSGLF
ncbi:YnbE family lipoprotein [Entomomonas asaccharolytica]|uniref:YnbE family lipoprotein n=1 Tax=Entomomonas asaccharolytica TaxID=2785331 RepID=A0A974NCW1_9GAMM|nr:YnbE family lipoprotein [Entomomonas asaccharolytica]QQP84295.1 YnbE family lipoprotein [Entomomonas asaccharolytica]